MLVGRYSADTPNNPRQYHSIGIPSEGELQRSPNVVWVEAYTRDDGTEVKGHYRSKPDNNLNNNLNSSQGTITGGASGVETTQTQDNVSQSETSKYDVSTPEKLQKLMYPDEIAGVKRGKPMTFAQMIQLGVNPRMYIEEDENGDYTKNCQCCTLAAELVLRGYAVIAGPYGIPEAVELGHSGKSAYLDPETGVECVPDIIYYNEISCTDYLEQNVKQGERYELIINTPTEGGNSELDKENENKAHGYFITRNANGVLVCYDPQNGDYFEGIEAKKYLDTWFQYERTIVAPPRILRVDNKALNPKYINKVVTSRGNL